MTIAYTGIRKYLKGKKDNHKSIKKPITKAKQKELLVEMIEADEKDGLYEEAKPISEIMIDDKKYEVHQVPVREIKPTLKEKIINFIKSLWK